LNILYPGNKSIKIYVICFRDLITTSPLLSFQSENNQLIYLKFIDGLAKILDLIMLIMLIFYSKAS